MESSARTVTPPIEAQPSRRPGWVWTTGWVILSAIVSAFPLRLALAGMADLQLFPEEAWDGTKGWPWTVTDAWSLAADLGYGLLCGFALAWAVRLAVRGRSDGWDVRLWPIACAMALVTASETQTAGFTGITLTVVVTREIALRPRSIATPRRGVNAAIVAGLAALVVATFTYQPLNPLLAAFPGQSNQLMLSDFDRHMLRSPRELQIRLENAGLGTVTLRSVRVVGPNAGLLDVETYGTRRSRPAINGARVARNSDFDARARLSKAACAKDAARYRIPSASVDAVVVRVETLGMVRTQRFDVKPSADLFCRPVATR